MASTNKTGNLNLTQFLATDKPSWLTDYNNDMQALDAAVTAGSIAPAGQSKSGTTHTVTFTGEGDLCRFTAAADFAKGDKLVLNGTELPLRDSEGAAFVAEAYKTGDVVVLALRPSEARVIAPQRNIVKAGAPTPLPFTYTDGISDIDPNRPSGYYKDQNNRVWVDIRCKHTSRFVHANEILTMPDGYRPKDTMMVPVAATGDDRFIVLAAFNTNGIVQLLNNTSGDKRVANADTIRFQFSYLANS